MKKTWWVVIAGILLFVGLIIGAQQILVGKDIHPLSKQNAVNAVETQYAGHVNHVILHGDVYKINMKNTFGTYNVKLDKDTGDILQLTHVKKSNENKKKNKQKPQKQLLRPRIDEHKAEQIALHRMKENMEIKKVKLKTDDGKPVYTVNGENANTETKLTINGNTGDISYYSTEEKDQNHPKKQSSTISRKKAKQIALSKIQGKGSVDEIKKESSDDSSVYKVKINTEDENITVEVQVYTGKIVSFTREDSDDD